MPKKKDDKIFRVIIETPKKSGQKFDFEPKQQVFVLNKIMPEGVVFPFDFGFIPDTIGEDGDPLDVMVLSELATFTGCAIDCRIIGVIKAEQQELDGNRTRNDRILAVPKISKVYDKIVSPKDLPKKLLNEIEYFFVGYNQQAGKSFEVKSFSGAQIALKLIEEGRKKNERKEILVQLFLPKNPEKKYENELRRLEKELCEKFGGLSIYQQSPVKGLWKKEGTTEKDELVILEVMAGAFDEKFWRNLKLKLQSNLDEEEILIRWMNVSVLEDIEV